jgi:hypothetical protein
MKRPRKKAKAKAKKMNPGQAIYSMIQLNSKILENSKITNKELREYKKCQKIVVKEYFPLIEALVAAGLFTTYCFDDNGAVAAFDVQDVGINGGIALESQNLIMNSDPPPDYTYIESSDSEFEELNEAEENSEELESINLRQLKIDKKLPN